MISDDSVSLVRNYNSLESGVPMGVILPSEKSYDFIITTMIDRTIVPFVFFFCGLIVLWKKTSKIPTFYEVYLIAAAYGFFFVQIAYYSAFMHFYIAYAISFLITLSLLLFYTRKTISPDISMSIAGLIVAFLLVPTIAVILQGYTGLIYCLEVLTGLAVLMFFTARKNVRSELDRLLSPLEKHLPEGETL